MARRFYRYHRMSPAELSAGLNALSLTRRRFSRICGARTDKIQGWLAGELDIPPHIPVLVALLHLPHALDTAKAVVDRYIMDEEESANG